MGQQNRLTGQPLRVKFLLPACLQAQLILCVPSLPQPLNRPFYYHLLFLPWAPQMILSVVRILSGKEYSCQCRRCGFNPWIGKVPWRRKWPPTPVFLPGKFHGQRCLADYSPWGSKRVRHNSSKQYNTIQSYHTLTPSQSTRPSLLIQRDSLS